MHALSISHSSILSPMQSTFFLHTSSISHDAGTSTTQSLSGLSQALSN